MQPAKIAPQRPHKQTFKGEFSKPQRQCGIKVTMKPKNNHTKIMADKEGSSSKQIEDYLAESELRFSVFMKYLPLAAFIKDTSGHFLFANEYMKDTLIAGNPVGCQSGTIFPTELAAKMCDDDQLALSQGLILTQYIIQDQYGDDRILDTYKFPIPLPDGSSILGGISLDVTERNLAEKALAEKQRQLEELNQSLEERVKLAVDELRKKDQMLIQHNRQASMGEMINNIAHQWRQPLNNIALIIQDLQSSYDAGEMTSTQMAADIEKAMDVITYMSMTIDDFRNFFRQDKDLHMFIVNRLVSRAIDFLQPALESSAIQVELTEEGDIIAEGYPNEYIQALLNILNNARDALTERSIPSPKIRIRIFRDNGHAVVTIGDNAGGIAEEVLPKIFDPYFTTKEQGKGSGIGLYMAKTIIEKNINGSLTATATEQGVEFRIEI